MFSNFIGGEAVGSSDAGPNIKPPNTQDVIGRFARGTAANVDAAVAAAKAAVPAWSRSNPQAQHDVLKKASDEALAVANDPEFGLSSGICTTSLKYATHCRSNAEAGMVMVNLPTAGVDYHAPFGGRKGSSSARASRAPMPGNSTRP